MSRILITGGTGFFGKSLLDYRLRHSEKKWPEWVVLSRYPERFKKAFPRFSDLPGVSYVAGDIRDFALPNGDILAIVHAAALLDPSLNEDDILSATIDGTYHLIEVALAANCKRILFPSSGAVYGQMTGPVLETSNCYPVSPYGKAKLTAEHLLLDSGIDTLVARCFSFVGKFLDREIYYAVGNFIRDALAGKDIVINGDGTPMRSYLYADDLVEWLFAILERGESGRVYNVGSDDAVSIRDLAVRVRDALGSKSEVKVLGQSVPGAANFYVPNVDRIKRELGVKVKVGLDEAIRMSVG